MATVAVPPEFSETVKICTNDVKMLPPVASGFQEDLSNLLHSAKEAMKLSKKHHNNKWFHYGIGIIITIKFDFV